MPWYVAFKRRNATVRTAYDDRNLAMLQQCSMLRPERSFVPLPVLIVDADRSAEEFADTYDAILDRVAALKWHPAAQKVSPVRFVEQGHLDYAAERDLPVVLHCAREGTLGSLDEVLDLVLPEFDRRGVRVDVAHAGFLHPRLPELAHWTEVFTDCCPWGAIRSSHSTPAGGGSERLNLSEILGILGGNVLLGFDSPWHIQSWDDGSVHGNPVETDLRELGAAMAGAGIAATWIAQRNPVRFLFG
jgi:hypothetical protein